MNTKLDNGTAHRKFLMVLIFVMEGCFRPVMCLFHKLRNKFGLICLLLVIMGCGNNNVNSKYTLQTQISKQLSMAGFINVNDSTLRVLEEWRIDSLGCMQLRGKRRAQFLVNSLELKGRSKWHLISALGKPNVARTESEYASTPKGEFEILCYYFDSICYGGAVVDSLDKCWADFLFSKSDNTLKDVVYICE